LELAVTKRRLHPRRTDFSACGGAFPSGLQECTLGEERPRRKEWQMKKRKKEKKLTLNLETLRQLTAKEVQPVAGGCVDTFTRNPCISRVDNC
jgi:hypothetical protein